MDLQIFSIYDKKTLVYSNPFYAHNKGHAVRLVSDEANSADSHLNKHPEDYSLVKIGLFDDSTGCITADQVEVVVDVNELIRKEK